MIELLPLSLTRLFTLKQALKSSDWLVATGAGVENEETLWEYVSQLCSYNYKLEPTQVYVSSMMYHI